MERLDRWPRSALELRQGEDVLGESLGHPSVGLREPVVVVVSGWQPPGPAGSTAVAAQAQLSFPTAQGRYEGPAAQLRTMSPSRSKLR